MIDLDKMLNNPLIVLALLLLGALYYAWTDYKAKHEKVQEPFPVPFLLPERTDVFDLSETPLVTIAGRAVQDTPNNEEGVQAALAYMRDDDSIFVGTYNIPLGWYANHGRALAYTNLLIGMDNELVSGMKNSGKDCLIMWQVLCLLAQNTPEQLQLFIIDTKGLDWGGFESKAHTFALYAGPGQIEEAMTALSNEQEKRRAYIGSQTEEHGTRKWSALPEAARPPLLLIIITELSLMISQVGKAPFNAWMNATLSSWRAFGGHIMVGTQVVNNLDTNWRGQLSLFMAAAQNQPEYDKPGTGFTTKSILELGGVPPSQLPPVPVNAGIFLLSSPNQKSVLNVRASLIEDAALVRMLARCPNKEIIASSDSLALRYTEAMATAATGNGRLMDDEQIIAYMRYKLQQNPKASRTAVATELWGYSGGSVLAPSTRLWEEAHNRIVEE